MLKALFGNNRQSNKGTKANFEGNELAQNL
jgi:hypothetical protein